MLIRGMDMGSKCHRAICPNGAMHTSPGCQPWEPHPREGVCSEGTPHRVGRGRCPRHGEYAAFLQNALILKEDSQSWHPGLVCDAPTGHGIGTVVFEWLQRSLWSWPFDPEMAPTEPCHLNGRFPGFSHGAPLVLGFWSGFCDGYSVSFLSLVFRRLAVGGGGRWWEGFHESTWRTAEGRAAATEVPAWGFAGFLLGFGREIGSGPLGGGVGIGGAPALHDLDLGFFPLLFIANG